MPTAAIALITSLTLFPPSPAPRDEIADRIAELGGAGFEEAVRALAALGKPAVPALVETLASAELDVAWQAARALRELGKDASAAKSKLSLLLKDEEVGAGRRAVACFAVGGLGPSASSATGALVECLSGEASDLQLLAALALVEIGKPSVSALAKAVKDEDDLFAAIWAVATLAQLGEDARSGSASLKRVLESPAKKKESPFFALRVAARDVLDELEVPYDLPLEASALLVELRRMEPDQAPIYPSRGGRMDAELMQDATRLRRVLSSALGMPAQESELPLALPDRFEDYDADGRLSAGEVYQGLAAFLPEPLGALIEDVWNGAVPTHVAWRSRAAELAGLCQVLRALTTREFLERSWALRNVVAAWEGLIPAKVELLVSTD